MPPRSKDWSGLKGPHFLTIIAPTENRNKWRKRLWLCQCECGKQVEHEPNQILDGRIMSCGCKSRRKYSGAEAAMYHIYHNRHHGLTSYAEADITFEKFKELTQQPCYWCGKWRPNVTTHKNGSIVKWHGLDRLDNNLTHTLANCVPCCWLHNNMRGNMTVEEFLTSIREIAAQHPETHE